MTDIEFWDAVFIAAISSGKDSDESVIIADRAVEVRGEMDQVEYNIACGQPN